MFHLIGIDFIIEGKSNLKLNKNWKKVLPVSTTTTTTRPMEKNAVLSQKQHQAEKKVLSH